MSFDLDGYLAPLRERIERALRDRLPPFGAPRLPSPDSTLKDPLRLREAMSGALLDGGKRLRPCLTLAACQAVGGPPERAVPGACAVEMVHAYSLVHDDLPALDNDELRRGKPTCHKRFGQATAILTGDALLTLAFEVLGSDDEQLVTAAARGLAVRELARAAGARGMIGGQALDLELKGKQPAFEVIELCHSGKTAAMFSAAAAIGGLVGGGQDREVEQLRSYGFDFGLAFQHADDLEDGSFPTHRARARERAIALAHRAAETARRFGDRGQPLAALAEQLETRVQRLPADAGTPARP
jgi:geranylgeranyl pyrophosphate synthase